MKAMKTMKVMKAPAMKAMKTVKAATGPTMKDSHPNKLKHVFCFGFKTSSAFLLSELIEELKQLIKKQYKQFEAYCKMHDHTIDDRADRKRFEAAQTKTLTSVLVFKSIVGFWVAATFGEELVKQNKSLHQKMLILKSNQEQTAETLNNLITAHNELRDEVKGKKGKGKGKGKDKK